MQKWKGCIVEESLDDNRVLNNIEVVKIKISSEEDPEKDGTSTTHSYPKVK